MDVVVPHTSSARNCRHPVIPVTWSRKGRVWKPFVVIDATRTASNSKLEKMQGQTSIDHMEKGPSTTSVGLALRSLPSQQINDRNASFYSFLTKKNGHARFLRTPRHSGHCCFLASPAIKWTRLFLPPIK